MKKKSKVTLKQKQRQRRKQKQKLMSKKIILATASMFVLLVAALGIKGAYASLTDKDTKVNDFKMTNLKGTIKEKFIPPGEESFVRPGEPYEKEVKVTNEDTAPFFVRLLVFPEITSDTGVLLPSEIGKEVLVDIDRDWILGEDGFYYYLKKVPKGESTSDVFKTVTLAPKLNNGEHDQYRNSKMEISLKSETVISSGNQYRNVWWQGKTPTDTNLKKVDDALQQLNKGGR